jgi:hypothetical protein
LAKLSGTWIGNKLTHTQADSATFTAISSTTFISLTDAFQLEVVGSLSGAITVKLRTFGITINNAVEPDGRTTAGTVNQYRIKPTITTNMVFNYLITDDVIYDTFKTDLTDGASFSFSLTNSKSIGSNGYIRIAGGGRITNSKMLSINKGYVEMSLTIENEYNYDGSAAEPLTVIINDSVDRNWEAPA